MPETEYDRWKLSNADDEPGAHTEEEPEESDESEDPQTPCPDCGKTDGCGCDFEFEYYDER